MNTCTQQSDEHRRSHQGYTHRDKRTIGESGRKENVTFFGQSRKAPVKFKVRNRVSSGRRRASVKGSRETQVLVYEFSSVLRSSFHVLLLVFAFVTVVIVVVRAADERHKAVITWRVWLLFHDEERSKFLPVTRDVAMRPQRAYSLWLRWVERGGRGFDGTPSGRKLCRVSPYAPIPSWLVMHSYVTRWRRITVTTIIHHVLWIIGNRAIFVQQFTPLLSN